MPVGAMIFLGSVLIVFGALDLWMLFTLLHPGDERNQIIVWKASSYTLLAMVGANILTVIQSFIKGEPQYLHPLVHLEVYAILYFFSLMYFKRKHGG